MPVSSLTMVPRFATGSSSNLLGTSRRPLNEVNSQDSRPATTAGRRDKAAFLEKVNNRRSLGIRVCGAESKLIMPGEAVAEELKDENQEGTNSTLRLHQVVLTVNLLISYQFFLSNSAFIELFIMFNMILILNNLSCFLQWFLKIATSPSSTVTLQHVWTPNLVTEHVSMKVNSIWSFTKLTSLPFCKQHLIFLSVQVCPISDL